MQLDDKKEHLGIKIMSIFKKFFGKSTENKAETSKSENFRGAHMPKKETPVDEKFILQFKENGGKFLYCLDYNEVKANFKSILEENDWHKAPAVLKDANLRKKLNSLSISFNETSSINNSTYFITSAEALVADIGAIMLSSNQLSETKIAQYPDNLIVIAHTNQLVNNISDGLSEIKRRKVSTFPSNISTIKHFKPEDSQDKDDFLTSSGNSKNVYLLLIEDY